MRIIIVGAGRVGKCLGPWHRSDRDHVKLVRRCSHLPKEDPDVLVFATGDDDLAIAVNTWAEHLAVRKSRLVLHTSGLHGLDALKPFEKRGEKIAAIHPLFTFPEIPRATHRHRLRGALVTHIQSRGARPAVLRLIEQWSGNPQALPAKMDRVRYHAALSMAANHLTSLTSLAADLLEPSMGDRALEAATTLGIQALQQVSEQGPEDGLTGPIVRGDSETLALHWTALPSKARPVYQALALSTIQLALRSGRISQGKARQLRKVLDA